MLASASDKEKAAGNVDRLTVRRMQEAELASVFVWTFSKEP
jgi:hypothetical protein